MSDSVRNFAPGAARRPFRVLIVWLCRLVGLMLFSLGIEYWIRLVGVYQGALWRFDLMPVAWKIVAPALAVLYPVAGVGMWIAVSWGAVVWTLVVGIEAVMHLMFQDLFGEATLVLCIHAAGLAAFVCLNLLDWRADRLRLGRSRDAKPFQR